MKCLLPCFLVFAAASWLMAQEEVSEDEKEDLELLERVVEVLDKASLSDVLEDKQRLQDLDLNDLPAAEKMLKDELKKLQADGIIPIEAIRKAVGGGLEGKEEAGNASDLLGPEPLKGQKVATENAGEWITIENSKYMAGDPKSGIVVFEGDVLVTNKGQGVENPFSMRCDKLIAHYERKKGNDTGKDGGKRLSFAEATGRMVVINGVNEEGDPVEVRCKKAVMKGETITLRDWPELSMPGRMMKARDSEAYIEATTGNSSKFSPRGAFEVKLKKQAEGEE
ncbi:hypothetical protein N9V84_03525 [Verrucomicrobiales bacterium]|nr:hypothetical protein [Verrucomicrobiales bacterium]